MTKRTDAAWAAFVVGIPMTAFAIEIDSITLMLIGCALAACVAFTFDGQR